MIRFSAYSSKKDERDQPIFTSPAGLNGQYQHERDHDGGRIWDEHHLICRQIRQDASRGTAAAAVAVAVSEADSRSEYEESIHGLEAVVIAGFPTMKFDSKAFKSKEDAQ
ncbi:hypothetical protein ACLOJK_006144 [Asimina triloba]